MIKTPQPWNKLILLLCCLLLAQPLNAEEQPVEKRCPRGWMRIPNPNGDAVTPGRHCAKAFTDRAVSMAEAKALCVENGGKLVEVNSPAENDFVKTLKPAATDDDDRIYWTGGNDLASHGVWVWASQSYRIYPYANWEEGSGPAAGVTDGKHCLALEPQMFKWRSEDCNELGYFICERRKWRFDIQSLYTAILG